SLFYCSVDRRDPHSFPTRRSSDLNCRAANCLLAPFREAWLRFHSKPGLRTSETANKKSKHRSTTDLRGIKPYRGESPRWSFYGQDRKSTRLNSSHVKISYAVFCLK